MTNNKTGGKSQYNGTYTEVKNKSIMLQTGSSVNFEAFQKCVLQLHFKFMGQVVGPRFLVS